MKSSSNAGGCEGGFGGVIVGRINIALVGLSRSPMKSGGGRMNCVGGGGGATEGGGGTKSSPSTDDTDIADPLDSPSPSEWPPVTPLKTEKRGTVGVGTLNPCTLSEEVWYLTVGLERTLAVPVSGMAEESNTCPK